MGHSLEVSEGLLWSAAGAIPWACQADCHIYSVRVQPQLQPAPDGRPTLRWVRYVIEDDDAHIVYVEVPDGCAPPLIAHLEIAGIDRRVREATPPWQR